MLLLGFGWYRCQLLKFRIDCVLIFVNSSLTQVVYEVLNY